MSIVQTCIVLPAREVPSDSWRFSSLWRAWLAGLVPALLRAFALLPVRDLMMSVDRTRLRSLLAPYRYMARRKAMAVRATMRQPEQAWTINRKRWAAQSHAKHDTNASWSDRERGTPDNQKSRAPTFVESPKVRRGAGTDETRNSHQRSTARDARRDPGGRRAS
jgi:hypothetical protein